MPNSLPFHLLWRSLNWLTRFAIVATGAFALLAAFAIIALRYWVLPNIEHYHGEITASLSRAIGNSVQIGQIEGDWHGLRPRLNFEDVRILDERQQTALVLPHIEGAVSWVSLFTAELRLANLEIDKPELLIRRDAEGGIFVGGVKLSRQGSRNDLADWLLRQSRMVVRDALIIWVDEHRDAPPLVLQQVNLRVENFFGQHRFALRALPPSELATPLDIRGDFHGASFDEPEKWRGQLYARLDYTDVTAWRSWLDLPAEFSHGRGALRGWLNIEQGRLAGGEADMLLHNVVTKLAADVPEMEMTELHGRVAWREAAGSVEISTRQLAMRLRDGLELQPTDFYYRSDSPTGGRPASTELRADALQLETLAGLAKFLPIDAGLRATLDAYAPRGRVSNLNLSWQGMHENRDGFRIPPSFKIRGKFENLAIHQFKGVPGFTGLSLEVDGSEAAGSMKINAHDLTVSAPGAMREPLTFATLTGQLGWSRKEGEWLFEAGNFAMANDDLAGKLFGSYQTQVGTMGKLDLTVALTRGDVRRAARYTPFVALDPEDNDWLNGAMQAGHTEDFRVRVKGNLSDFPLDGSEKDALLEVGGHARGVTFEFDKDWPRIEDINGEFWIRGNRMEVKAVSATTLGARLQNVSVGISDLMSDELPLEFSGEAVGPSNTYLDYVQRSPVRGYIDGFTDGMRAAGSAQLTLSARIPLQGDNPVKVSGNLRVAANEIDLGEGAPLLRDTRGTLMFSESSMSAKGVTAEILGGPARVDMHTEPGGVVHARVTGRADLNALRKREPHPLLDRVSGDTDWEADISVVKKATELTINSDLRGIVSTLPQPFAKRAEEALPLRLEKKHVTQGQDVIVARLGELMDMRLARRERDGKSVIERGKINFGGSDSVGKQEGTVATDTARDGVWFTGRLPQLSMQGWDGLGGDDTSSGMISLIAGGDVTVEKLTGFGQEISGLRIEAARRGEGLAAKLSGPAMNGEVEWLPRGFKDGVKISAKMRDLQWTLDKKPVPPVLSASSIALRVPESTSGVLPALEISAENLKLNDKDIGRFDLVGYPEGRDWLLRRVNFNNPDGSLTGDGRWHGDEKGGLTQVNLQLDIRDAGQILARSGYPDTVRNGSGKMFASLTWKGDPDEFNYETLYGSLKLDTGKGQFLKMDPGAGKLLSVLSLQSLPKRIVLDFTDVFSAGFQFDSINGTATIRDGVMETRDFSIDGSSARVNLSGSVDLSRETQHLNVRVLPTLGDSVSLLGAFAAGPAVGIGTLIVNKVLGNPLDKLVSFEYNVIGSWSDPVVIKVGQTAVVPNKNNPSQ